MTRVNPGAYKRRHIAYNKALFAAGGRRIREELHAARAKEHTRIMEANQASIMDMLDRRAKAFPIMV